MKGMMILILIMKVNIIFSQNLVSNPGFEDTIACPISFDMPWNATGWSSFGQSPDYYNSCALLSTGASVPYNVVGFQQAFSGNAYMGLQTFFTPGYREFIGSPLNQPLIIGEKYFVSMRACCAFGSFPGGLQAACSSNKLGLLFSTLTYTSINSAPVGNFAHVYSDSILKDTIHWTNIHGSFVADSAYAYIIIGNFYDDAHTDTLQFINGYRLTYYLIDDVCVSRDSLGCEIFESVDHIKNDLNLVYFDPINSSISIKLLNPGGYEISMFNCLGEMVFKRETVGEELVLINTRAYNNGIYFIKIVDSGKSFLKKILIVN